VGYLDFRYFSGLPEAEPTAAAAMGFLANTDAVIFDLRRNGGGNPKMVRYVCSYLFDRPLLLASIYWRADDRLDEYRVLDELPGPRLVDVPAFVLTSTETFSGAEAFAGLSWDGLGLKGAYAAGREPAATEAG